MTLLSDEQVARLHACDTSMDVWPLRAVEAPRERIVHIHLDTDDNPQYELQRALDGWYGAPSHRLAWTRAGVEETRRWLVEVCRQQYPSLVFMQLQTPGVLDAETLRAAREAAPEALFVSWCGDVGGNNGPSEPPVGWAWLDELVDNIHLGLFASTRQVDVLRDRGHPNVGHLSIGYDQRTFRPPSRELSKWWHAAFLGSNYGTHFEATVPGNEATLRVQLVYTLRARLGAAFFVGGGGWRQQFLGPGVMIPPQDSPEIYHRARLAISMSLVRDLGRCSSNRLLRALACGTPTIVREFTGMRSWGLRDLENCIVWSADTSVDEIVERIVQFDAGIGAARAAVIGHAGAELAARHHTWEVRMRTLAVYLAALRDKIVPLETLPG